MSQAVEITDQALLQFMSAVLGWDVDGIRRTLADRVRTGRAHPGQVTVVARGVRYRLDAGRVVAIERIKGSRCADTGRRCPSEHCPSERNL